MIAMAYIHEYDLYDEFVDESAHLENDVYDLCTRYNAIDTLIQEKVYFDESADDEILVLEAEKKNIFTRIGEVIIQIMTAFVDTLKGIGTAIKDSITGFRKKSQGEKLKKALDSNPELADEFLRGVMSGKLKATDVKNMQSALDEACKISNQLIDGKLGEKDFSDKVDGIGEKIKKCARPVVEILGIVSAATSAIVGIDKVAHLKSDRKNAEEDRDSKKELNKLQQQKIGLEIDKLLGMEAASADLSDVRDREYYMQEAALGDVCKKVSDFLADKTQFLDRVNSSFKGLEDRALSKLQAAPENDPEASSKFSTLASGLRKLMSYFVKDANETKNISAAMVKALPGEG